MQLSAVSQLVMRLEVLVDGAALFLRVEGALLVEAAKLGAHLGGCAGLELLACGCHLDG